MFGSHSFRKRDAMVCMRIPVSMRPRDQCYLTTITGLTCGYNTTILHFALRKFPALMMRRVGQQHSVRFSCSQLFDFEAATSALKARCFAAFSPADTESEINVRQNSGNRRAESSREEVVTFRPFYLSASIRAASNSSWFSTTPSSAGQSAVS